MERQKQLLRAARQIHTWKKRVSESFEKLATRPVFTDSSQNTSTLRPILGQLVKGLGEPQYLTEVASRMSKENLDWLLNRIDAVCGTATDPGDVGTVMPRPVNLEPFLPDWKQKREWHAHELVSPAMLHDVVYTLKYKIGAFCHDALSAPELCRAAMCVNTRATMTDLIPPLSEDDVSLYQVDCKRQIERIQMLFDAAIKNIPAASEGLDADAAIMARSYAGFSLHRLGAITHDEPLRSFAMELQCEAVSVPSDPSTQIWHNFLLTFEYQLVNLKEEAEGYGPHVVAYARDAMSCVQKALSDLDLPRVTECFRQQFPESLQGEDE